MREAKQNMSIDIDREKERKCGADGFLDSGRYRHSFTVKREKKEAKDKDDKARSLSVVDLVAKKERDQKEFDRRMKVIEVSHCKYCVWYLLLLEL